MHEFPWMWVVFGTLFWLFFMRVGRLRVCQERWSSGQVHDPSERPRRRMHRAGFAGTPAERDALIARLEERVRVLERIVTDDSGRLRAEIDSLSESPPSERRDERGMR